MTDDGDCRSLDRIVPDDIFVGVSLILRREDRFLFGLRPSQVDGDGRRVLELTGIGGGIEAIDDSFWAGALREAREEIGCGVQLRSASTTLVVRGRGEVESVALSDEERPVAVVFRRYRTPPHEPWHDDHSGEAWLIVFEAVLSDEPKCSVEHPALPWLRPSQLVETARRDVPLQDLIAAGAILQTDGGEIAAGRVRLTDSQEALVLALGDRAEAFYGGLGSAR